MIPGRRHAGRRAGGLAVLAGLAALAGGTLGAQTADAAPVITPRPLAALRADSAALLLSGGEGGPVRLALLALPAYRTDGKPRLFLYAEIAGESLLREAADGPLGVELSVYLLDATGGVVAHASEGLRLPPAGERADLAASGVRYATALDAAPGDYTVRLLARLRPAGGFGLREATVRLAPAAQSGAPAAPLRPVPLWPGPSGSWSEARSPSLAADEPPRLPGAGWPATFPVLAAGGELPLLLAVPARARPSSPLAARLVPFAGGEERSAAVTVGAPAGALGGGLEALAATLDARNAPPGGYTLRFGDAGDGVDASRAAARLVLAAAAADGAVPASWVEATRGAPPRGPGTGARAEPETTAPSEPRGDRDAEVARLRGEILGAFARIADGDLDGATSALLELEVAVFTRVPRRALIWLEEAHGQARAAVTGLDPETLLPLALAYADLADKAAVAWRTALSQLAQETAGQLAGEYARRGSAEGASDLASRTYLGLAGRFYDLGSPRRTQRLLLEADALDPGDGTAARLAAFIHERHDERAEAARVLRRLLEHRPADREARLRLALCELGLGESAGERRLRDLLDEPAGDWVGAVAAQELVRLELADRRFAEATQLAREGLRRHPSDPGLRTQLSWALQQAGHASESLAALDPLLTRGAADPPRRRYSAWPREVLREARRDAEQAAQLRLPALRAALDRIAADAPTGARRRP